MFSIMKKNRSVIPTRLPEEVGPVNQKPEVLADTAKPEVPDPLNITDDDRNSENTETPPLTPRSDLAGDASTDEEPTIEEVRTPHTHTQELPVVGAIVTHRPSVERSDPITDYTFSSDDNLNSEEGPECDDDRNKSQEDFKYKLLSVWFFFWIVALTGGIIAYFLHTKHEIAPSQRISDDVEPVLHNNLLLVPREKWDDSTDVVAKPSSYMAQKVVTVQTDTEICHTITTCSRLLNAMKRREGMVNYNFLLATNGFIYEALGWQEPSPMYPETRTMVVGFIGNFATNSPSTMQLTQFAALLKVSVELKYLVECYTIVGRKQTVMPIKLFSYLAKLKHWDKENSDNDEQYLDIDLEPPPIFDD